MKNHTTLLAVAVIGVFALSSCAEGNLPADRTLTPTSPSGIQLSDAPQTDMNQPQIPVMPQYSEADTAAYSGAIQLKDLTFCDKIKDAEYVKQCKTSVADAEAVESALEKKDGALCDKLSTDDKKDACKIQVEALIKAQQQKQEAAEQRKSQGEEYDKIFQSGNYEACTKLTDPLYADICAKGAVVAEAVEKKDITICDKLGDKQSIDNCKISYNQHMQTVAETEPTQLL